MPLMKRVKPLMLYALLILTTLSFLLPFLFMILTSFKYPSDVFSLPLRLLPKRVTLDNFIKGWNTVDFTTFTKNTVFVASLATLGATLSSILVAYGFARFQARSSALLFGVLMATMMIPTQITLIPTYLIYTKLKWIDTYLPLILPSWLGGGAFNIFLLRQFILTLPREMDQAATIDGANSFQILARIIVPALKPAITTVVLMTVTLHWNDFFAPLIYLNSNEKFTIAVGLRFFQSSYSTEIQLMLAVSTITMIPILILFFCAQKYFVQGIVMSGLKG